MKEAPPSHLSLPPSLSPDVITKKEGRRKEGPKERRQQQGRKGGREGRSGRRDAQFSELV